MALRPSRGATLARLRKEASIDCATCDRKVKKRGEYCPICKRFRTMMKQRARNVEAGKKRKAKK